MNKRITDYLLVKANDDKELVELVKENIDPWGWTPLGGVAVMTFGAGKGSMYYQAMVKYEREF